jgi:hypothetical protein
MSNPIKEMQDYVKNFVEKPHPAFGNLPVCPFAAWARRNNLLFYKLADLRDIPSVLSAVASLNGENVLILVDQDKDISLSEIEAVIATVEQEYPALAAFGGGPLDDYKLNGVETRHEPYPTLIVQVRESLERRERLLKGTRYYSGGNGF